MRTSPSTISPSISLTVSGIMIFFKFAQLEKQPFDNVVVLSGTIISVKPSQPEKAAKSIRSGSIAGEMLSMDPQSANAHFPIYCVRIPGKFFSAVHPSNAFSSMVTGHLQALKSTVSRLVWFCNAARPISRMFSLNTMRFISTGCAL